MELIVKVIHIFAALGLIGFILLQQGKGAEAGASFGAGASQTIFGSQGTGSLMTRITAIFATIFFITSLALGYLALHKTQQTSLDKLVDKVQNQSIEHSEKSTSTSTSTSTNQSVHEKTFDTNSDIPEFQKPQLPDNLNTEQAN